MGPQRMHEAGCVSVPSGRQLEEALLCFLFFLEAFRAVSEVGLAARWLVGWLVLLIWSPSYQPTHLNLW